MVFSLRKSCHFSFHAVKREANSALFIGGFRITEVHAHYRANDFAVLIAEKFASKTECRVYKPAQNSVKFVHNWKKSAKSGDFAIFKGSTDIVRG